MCGEKSLPLVDFPGKLGSPPAYAGKRRLQCQHSPQHWNHPRVCGEKFMPAETSAFCTGSPPRVRGKGCNLACRVSAQGITPAYAGKRCFRIHHCAPLQDHPRVCGEKKGQQEVTRWLLGSPPRVRGKGKTDGVYGGDARITPACAGKSGGWKVGTIAD